jgi:hypothetical protein
MPGPLDPGMRLSADLLTGQGLSGDTLPPAHWRIGTVESVGTGTVAVTIGGVSVPALRFVQGLVPQAGDLVLVLIQGPDHFILGKMSTDSSPLSGTVVPMCRRTRDTAANIANNTVSAALGWNILDFDTDGMAVGSSIIIQTAGVYTIGYRMTFDLNGTGRRIAIVQKNAAELIRMELNPVTGGAQSYCEGQGTYNLAQGDDLTLHGFQTSGGTLGTAVTSYQRPFLEAVWQGATS